MRLRVFSGNQIKLARKLEPATDKDFDERGASVFEIDLGDSDIRTEELDDSSFRVDVVGDDAWRPRHLAVWAQDDNNRVLSLAVEMDLDVTISRDPLDDPTGTDVPARPSLTLQRVSQGTRPEQTEMLNYLVVARTEVARHSGTAGEIVLEVNYNDHQDSMPLNNAQPIGRTRAIVEVIPGAIRIPGQPAPPRNRNSLKSVVLRSASSDKWLPASFFVLGAFPGNAPPITTLIPLVHIPRWSFEGLSTDTNEGALSIELPLAQIVDFPFDDIPSPPDMPVTPVA